MKVTDLGPVCFSQEEKVQIKMTFCQGSCGCPFLPHGRGLYPCERSHMEWGEEPLALIQDSHHDRGPHI